MAPAGRAARAVELGLLALAERTRWTALLCVAPVLWLALSVLTLVTMGAWQGWAVLAALEAFATIQMVDVHLPTTDGRHLVLPRHTRPNKEHELLGGLAAWAAPLVTFPR